MWVVLTCVHYLEVKARSWRDPPKVLGEISHDGKEAKVILLQHDCLFYHLGFYSEKGESIMKLIFLQASTTSDLTATGASCLHHCLPLRHSEL